MKRVSLIALAALVILLGGWLFLSGRLKILSRSSVVTPDILYLTSPVTVFSGRVDKIAGNTLWVSQKLSSSAQNKMVIFKVRIGQKTVIERPQNTLAYLFKPITPTPPPKPTASDIRVGQTVTAYTSGDLRTASNNEFEATIIALPPVTTSIYGKFVSVSGETLTLTAQDPANPNQQKTYSVSVTKDTEISGGVGLALDPSKPSAPQKFELSYLKSGMQVNVYSVEDVILSSNLTALRIEPLQ